MAGALAMTRPAGTMVPSGWQTLTSTVTGMMAAGVLDAEPLVSRRFGLDEVNEALAAALDRDLITGVIVPA
jgi:threonine dehydrogenase-like Zn-dependent dehydrogenase